MPSLAALLLLALPTAASPPSGLRLGTAVRPLREAVDLRIVPNAERFSGVVDLDLELREKTSQLWLNGTGLEVTTARIEFQGRSRAVRVLPADADHLGVALDRAVGPGKARLHVEYRGVLSSTETQGLFRQREGDEWYAFSQLEPTDARRAFPCFDEPSFKIPWRLTLHVRDADVAVSNMPVVGTVREKDGSKRVDFAETPPMPSYLVALGVGPFDIVDAGVAGRKRIPLRILTPRGRGRETAWAAEATPRLLERLEEYFDLPYPYDKLDALAVPVTEAFGAMENAGLVTYAESLLLRKPGQESTAFRRAFADVCAHELAHQWFGDLVTLAWWDDVWLNESLASWMGTKVLDGWKPQWAEGGAAIASRLDAMRLDSAGGARRIRQPILSKQDILDAFDAITYVKGEAVVRMFESWLGEDVFRKGVQRYLGRHAWGNATTADFLAALSAKAGRDVAPAFSTFLDQGGVPLLSVELRCPAGGGTPTLRLTQEPYQPLGTHLAPPPRWQLPVCVRAGREAQGDRACSVLTEQAGELTLGPGTPCPKVVVANAGETGYYLARYPREMLQSLLADGGRGLTAAERVGLLGSIEALAESGAMPAGEALAFLPALAQDPDRQVVESTIAMSRRLGGPLRDVHASYARFLRDAYGARARGLGWKSRSGDSEDTRALRRSLLSVVAVDGEDEALDGEAVALARRWLADPKEVDPDLVDPVLHAAARRGGPTLFEEFRTAALATPDRERRVPLLRALGTFREPALLEQALSLMLNEALDPRESSTILWSAAQGADTGATAYAFLKAHFEALGARLPREQRALLPQAGGLLCSAEQAADLEAFFRPRIQGIPPRVLDGAVEQVRLCAAYRSAQQGSANSFLGPRAE